MNKNVKDQPHLKTFQEDLFMMMTKKVSYLQRKDQRKANLKLKKNKNDLKLPQNNLSNNLRKEFSVDFCLFSKDQKRTKVKVLVSKNV